MKHVNKRRVHNERKTERKEERKKGKKERNNERGKDRKKEPNAITTRKDDTVKMLTQQTNKQTLRSEKNSFLNITLHTVHVVNETQQNASEILFIYKK